MSCDVNIFHAPPPTLIHGMFFEAHLQTCRKFCDPPQLNSCAILLTHIFDVE